MLGAVLWILPGLPSAIALTEFIVPGPAPYPRWNIGELQNIRYRTTLTEYTISLWQQLDGAANLGPILFRMFSDGYFVAEGD